ncbi:MAG: hypothetical protein A2Y33_16670 [Spirochaetes bacterium GWF1_51_8]|nr:MAG: hypothetical protein A2Y33_16670 [Spirochaetes bacterium GWF1_51_8]
MKITNDTPAEYSISEIFMPDIVHARFCVFDMEGTGMDTVNDRIIQIGAVIVENGKINPSRKFESLVNPGITVPPQIERFTGIKNERLLDAPGFGAVYERFRQFIGDDKTILIAHCGFEYDFSLLQQECKRAGLEYFVNPKLDTKVMFANLYPERKETFSTDFLLLYYRIQSDDVTRHTAAGDSILTGRILENILNDYKILGISHFKLVGSRRILKFIPQVLK